jgi:hypothetical protein
MNSNTLTEEEEIEEYTVTSRHYYTFNVNSDTGYVLLTPKHIKLCFPEKDTNRIYNIYQNTVLFINGQQIFSYDLLPILSYYDFIQVNDMFSKCLNKLSELTNERLLFYSPHVSGYQNELVTTIESSFGSINCFENVSNTSIEIYTYSPPETEKQANVTFQIYIGNHLVMCTKRDFNHIPAQFLIPVLYFTLSKFIK